MSASKYVQVKWVVGFAILAIIFIVVSFLLLREDGVKETDHFNRELWLRSSDEMRGKQVFLLFPGNEGLSNRENLLDDRSLVFGKTKTEIESFLGPPDSDPSGFLMYDVGFLGRNSSDPFVQPYSLILQFDEQGVLKQALVSH